MRLQPIAVQAPSQAEPEIEYEDDSEYSQPFLSNTVTRPDEDEFVYSCSVQPSPGHARPFSMMESELHRLRTVVNNIPAPTAASPQAFDDGMRDTKASLRISKQYRLQCHTASEGPQPDPAKPLQYEGAVQDEDDNRPIMSDEQKPLGLAVKGQRTTSSEHLSLET